MDQQRFYGLFLPARWSDGQPARTTDDRVSQALLLGGIALALTCTVVTWWDGSQSMRDFLIAVPIAPLTWFAMNWRLHVVVRRVEESRQPLPVRPPSLHDRILEFGAKKADQKAEKLLARADQKEVLGEEKEAARLRRLADKEKAQAVKGRALIKRHN